LEGGLLGYKKVILTDVGTVDGYRRLIAREGRMWIQVMRREINSMLEKRK
jgi:hypothetical protein